MFPKIHRFTSFSYVGEGRFRHRMARAPTQETLFWLAVKKYSNFQQAKVSVHDDTSGWEGVEALTFRGGIWLCSFEEKDENGEPSVVVDQVDGSDPDYVPYRS